MSEGRAKGRDDLLAITRETPPFDTINQRAMLAQKLERVRSLFKEMGTVLVAFSGGTDSSLVFRIAHDTLGSKALAVTAISPTFPAVELDVTRRVASEIGGRHVIMNTDQLSLPDFVRNDAARCYHCKADLYQALRRICQEQGIGTIVDGTNLDDLGDDRPGITAANEWGVRSPLVEAELSKQDIRSLAKELGLPNWDKPAAACLSSRIPRGTPITLEKLQRVEQAEAILFQEGLLHVRVRDHGDVARVELDPKDFAQLLEGNLRRKVVTSIKKLGFLFVTLDLEGYRAGSTNQSGSGSS